ncbi:SUPPRESSOR OF, CONSTITUTIVE protein [Arabidopsis thaliana]|uniref:SUPPRESSOR OF, CONSTITUTIVE protein n=1 Tax=Arabidopsis thaliana TaxID=3702 RepID=A0A1P8B3D3_ARATH|nr:SUPPRESSOR OF, CONSTITUTIVE protein [Arabidopsis thaliana]ANM66109.1 SUPPRESSOR OF, CONSTITUTIVE protein [Arabidopsis thaliana]|eukprot:NP_001328025.1 SUPPRESSOR OF, CONSTITUTIVE protein [Arabidopsis thaliana]
MVLPGGEVPAYFKHRAYGNSVNITLPRRSLSHKFLRFNACVVVEPQTDSYGSVYVYFQYKGEHYIHTIATDMTLMCKTDHLVLCSFKFRQFKNTLYPKVKVLDNVEFKFKGRRIKGCGVQLLHVSPYPDDSDGSSKAEYNQQSGEKCDAVETESSSKKRMRMTLGNSEEDFNLPCGQTVTDTGLTAPNLELPLGRGESSSISYPCLEGEAFSVDSMITKRQAKEIPIAHRDEDSEASWSSGSSGSSSSSSLVPF